MHLEPELIEELNLLKRFSLSAGSEIELDHSLDPAALAAAGRLHAKGLITQAEGGLLTDRGREAADDMNRLFSLLSPPLEPI